MGVDWSDSSQEMKDETTERLWQRSASKHDRFKNEAAAAAPSTARGCDACIHTADVSAECRRHQYKCTHYRRRSMPY